MFEDAEKRVRRGSTTYWKDGVMIGRKCTTCGKDKEISEFSFRKERGFYKSKCKECEREKQRKEYKSKKEKKEKEKKKDVVINENGLEVRNRNGFITYWKNGILVSRKCSKCGVVKEMNEFPYANQKKGVRSPECKECKNNRTKIQSKEWRKNNSEYSKRYSKQYRKACKDKNISDLTKMLKQINPILKELNLKAYGSIYKVTNIKTGKSYIGQTIRPLNVRYGSDIIKAWIKEREKIKKQKFTEELINEDDFMIEESIAVGVCEYHLNALESYFINKYNSYECGYNNCAGNHITNDGKEEFEQILKENGLQFIDGKLIAI